MQEKTLYLINDDQDDYVQLKELVKAGFIEAERTDYTAKIVNCPAALYMNEGLKAGQKALFVGDIGNLSSSKRDVEYVFNSFGVRYGWSGPNRAYIDIDEELLKDEDVYHAFYEEYKQLPVYSAKKGDARRRNKLGQFLMTYVLPFGFIKTMADSYGDNVAVRKQLHAYALIMFYNNHLYEFMDM